MAAVRDVNCSLDRLWGWSCSNWPDPSLCKARMKENSDFKRQKPSLVWPLSQSKFRWLFAPDCGKRVCFDHGGSMSQYEVKLNNAAACDFGIFCDFLLDDELCQSGATCSSPSAPNRSSCFYSIILSANYVQKQPFGQPPIKVHIWINLENNRDFAPKGELLTSHHVEVYRGHANHHRLHLRIFFSVAILLQIVFQNRHPKLKRLSLHHLQPLIIFLWIASVSFLPETSNSLQSSSIDTVKSSTYLLLFACALSIRTIFSPSATQGKSRYLYFCGAGVTAAVVLVHFFLSDLLFPNDRDCETFWRLLVLLSVNVIAGMKLRKDNRNSDTNFFVFVSIHIAGLVLLFFVFPPAELMTNHDLIRFVLIRLIEVSPCAACPAMPVIFFTDACFSYSFLQC
jgi:hypothetical protein